MVENSHIPNPMYILPECNSLDCYYFCEIFKYYDYKGEAENSKLNMVCELIK